MERKNRFYNCLLLHDFNPSIVNFKEWYPFIIEWFKINGQTPGRMSLDGEKVKLSDKTKTFKHYDRVINEINFEGITNLWIGGGYPENYGDDQRDPFLGVDFDAQYRSMLYYFDNEIISFSQSEVDKLTKQLLHYVNPTYGYFYQMKRTAQRSPYSYGIGIIGGGLTREEEREISNWDKGYNDQRTYKTGDFRDIYPINYLTAAHLQRPVNGQAFLEWVLKSKSANGNIKPLTDSVWVWEIAEENIPQVREALKAEGYLVAFREPL